MKTKCKIILDDNGIHHVLKVIEIEQTREALCAFVNSVDFDIPSVNSSEIIKGLELLSDGYINSTNIITFNINQNGEYSNYMPKIILFKFDNDTNSSHIKHIELNNFKSFENLELSCGRLNLIYSSVGGKTNLLDGIELTFNPTPQNMLNLALFKNNTSKIVSTNLNRLIRNNEPSFSNKIIFNTDDFVTLSITKSNNMQTISMSYDERGVKDYTKQLTHDIYKTLCMNDNDNEKVSGSLTINFIENTVGVSTLKDYNLKFDTDIIPTFHPGKILRIDSMNIDYDILAIDLDYLLKTNGLFKLAEERLFELLGEKLCFSRHSEICIYREKLVNNCMILIRELGINEIFKIAVVVHSLSNRYKVILVDNVQNKNEIINTIDKMVHNYYTNSQFFISCPSDSTNSNYFSEVTIIQER